MFEDLIKTLGNLNGRSVSVNIEADEKGYLDKQCPAENCEFLFKVNDEDWKNIFTDEAVWCPMCRHEAPSKQWFTVEQVEHLKSEALTVVKGEINNALRSGAQKFNQRQPRNSFISMSMEVKGGVKRTYTLPAKAAEVMQRVGCGEARTASIEEPVSIADKRYWEHLVRDEEDFARHAAYIHWNPVKHGWVTRVQDWPYSSFHAYVKRGLYPEDWSSEPEEMIQGGE